MTSRRFLMPGFGLFMLGALVMIGVMAGVHGWWMVPLTVVGMGVTARVSLMRTRRKIERLKARAAQAPPRSSRRQEWVFFALLAIAALIIPALGNAAAELILRSAPAIPVLVVGALFLAYIAAEMWEMVPFSADNLRRVHERKKHQDHGVVQ